MLNYTKKWVIISRLLSFRGWQGMVGDGRLPTCLMVRQFLIDWFKIPILGQPKL